MMFFRRSLTSCHTSRRHTHELSRSHLRTYGTGPEKPGRSPHAQWYADVLPGMIPVAILGSAVYLGLQLAQAKLSHEKFLDEARARVEELEAEVEALQADSAKRDPKEASVEAAKGTTSRWWYRSS